MVRTTNEAFERVSSIVQKGSSLVAEITVQSLEQAQGIEHINRAVTEMDKVVQMNSATAEESASASEEMNAQAHEMHAFVNDLLYVIRGEKGFAKKEQPTAAVRPARHAPAHKSMPCFAQAVAPKIKPAQQRLVSADELVPLDEDDLPDLRK